MFYMQDVYDNVFKQLKIAEDHHTMLCCLNELYVEANRFNKTPKKLEKIPYGREQ